MARNRAFTLIELLVVIAIIAILAAILFPVFAQAKAAAKKTADLSNSKQLVLGVLMYDNDYDDMNPLQSGMDSTGTWGYNFNKLVPATWDASGGVRTLYSEGFADNTIEPYLKNYGILEIPGSTNWNWSHSADPIVPGQTQQNTSYAYNGFLSAYSSTAIADPVHLPVWSEVEGFAYGVGWGFANPALTCPQKNLPCSYQPYSSSCSSGVNGQQGAMYVPASSEQWVYGQGQNWGYSDGHGKFRHISTSPLGVYNYNQSPWDGIDANGNELGYYWSDGCHAWLYRPDATYPE